jgi:assimilatory nitrate reductase catalytic subunit
VDRQYPLRLITGRLRDQWHSMSRTGTVARLFGHEPEPRVTMHPTDLNGWDAQVVRLSSRRGEIYVRAAGDPGLPRGTVFLPMHWGSRFLGAGINELTIGALDPSSRQPELKHCAVRVEEARLPWQLVAFGTPHDGDLAALMERLEPFMRAAPYAARTLMGRDVPAVRLVLAAPEFLDVAAEIDAAFGLDAGEVLRYEDARIALHEDRLRGVRIAGDIRPEGWLRELWEKPGVADELRRYSRLPTDKPPGRGRTVCNCFDVAEAEIAAFDSLEELQAKLRCGTNCGSCLPELRRQLVQSAALAH